MLWALHISEFGRICAKDPDKAAEVVTGFLSNELVVLHEGVFSSQSQVIKKTRTAVQVWNADLS
jgi:hypothetical protein